MMRAKVCPHGRWRTAGAIALLMGLSALSAQAAIVTTGDVLSSNAGPNPANWTNSTNGLVANFADGSIMITGGSTVRAAQVQIGRDAGLTGSLSVDGAGSSWTGNIQAGGELGRGGGIGIVNISNG